VAPEGPRSGTASALDRAAAVAEAEGSEPQAQDSEHHEGRHQKDDNAGQRRDTFTLDTVGGCVGINLQLFWSYNFSACLAIDDSHIGLIENYDNGIGYGAGVTPGISSLYSNGNLKDQAGDSLATNPGVEIGPGGFDAPLSYSPDSNVWTGGGGVNIGPSVGFGTEVGGSKSWVQQKSCSVCGTVMGYIKSGAWLPMVL